MRPGTTIEALVSLKPALTGLGEAGFDRVATMCYPEIEQITMSIPGGSDMTAYNDHRRGRHNP